MRVIELNKATATQLTFRVGENTVYISISEFIEADEVVISLASTKPEFVYLNPEVSGVQT